MDASNPARSGLLERASISILVVDDVPENLTAIGGLLRAQGYRVQAASAGPVALRYAAQLPQPDLILLDVVMPGMDGYEVLHRLQQDTVTAHIPVVFLTALGDARDEERGLELGAVDYITKPIRPPVVLARVRTQLEAKRARDILRDQNAMLEAEVSRRMADNELIQEVSIRALAHLAETRDPETGNHILRTQAYVRLLAEQLRAHERFAPVLNERYITLLTRSAPLHDIGKVGIPDHILLKPGRLTPAEFEQMKTHAPLGAQAIEQAERDTERSVEFLALAKEIARGHHEKWDGSGYPQGLAGEAIPISARLMALADVFDALITTRVYKPAFSFERAREIILEGRGLHFDPAVVDAFLASFDQFVSVARAHQDPGIAGDPVALAS
jgi:putative two-component system response regulator